MRSRIRTSAAGVMFLTVVLFPCVLAAQNVNPPPCCNEAPTVTASTGVQSSIVMTDDTLAGMGVSRTQFVDRLISLLMPARQVSLVYSTTTSLNPAAEASVTADGQMPEMVTVTQRYRVPREMIAPEAIEGLDQLLITDGIVSIAISFRRAETIVPIP